MRDPFGSPGRQEAEDHAGVTVVEAAELEAESEARRRGDRGFGPLVRQLREDREVRLGALAKGISVGVVLISNLELGKVRVTPELIRRIANWLEAPFSLLFDVWDREAPDAADRMTVAEAQAMVKRLRSTGEGVECPCCGAKVKERRRSLTPPMIRFIRWLVREHTGEPVLITPWVKDSSQHGGDYAKIELWGLAHRHPGQKPMWSPTPKGVAFVRGQVKVHRIAVVFRGEVLTWDGPKQDIDEMANEDVANEVPERGDGPAPTLPGMDKT